MRQARYISCHYHEYYEKLHFKMCPGVYSLQEPCIALVLSIMLKY
jgi:hypothetical protein